MSSAIEAESREEEAAGRPEAIHWVSSQSSLCSDQSEPQCGRELQQEFAIEGMVSPTTRKNVLGLMGGKDIFTDDSSTVPSLMQGSVGSSDTVTEPFRSDCHERDRRPVPSQPSSNSTPLHTSADQLGLRRRRRAHSIYHSAPVIRLHSSFRNWRNKRRNRPRRKPSWLIPANHPLKIAWDVITVILSFLSVYATHRAIRDRQYEPNHFVMFSEVWFFLDIVFNFVTEHRTSNGKVLKQGKAVWARYLTTWFAIDVLSLVPWERVFVKPIIEMQNKRGFFQKLFFRTRGAVRVSRKLRGNHFRLFGRVVNHTKYAGVGSSRLLRMIIKYVPKYFLFLKNMRGVLAVRALRQVHWIRKLIRNLWASSSSSRPVQKIKRVVSSDNFTRLVNKKKLKGILTTPPRFIRSRSVMLRNKFRKTPSEESQILSPYHHLLHHNPHIQKYRSRSDATSTKSLDKTEHHFESDDETVEYIESDEEFDDNYDSMEDDDVIHECEFGESEEEDDDIIRQSFGFPR